MHINSRDPVVIGALEQIAATVIDNGGHIHPKVTVNHDGPNLWLSIDRTENPYSDRAPGKRPPGDAPVLLQIPNALHIPVTDLDWDVEADHLHYRGDASHLTPAQRTILDAMVELFNACGKVPSIGRAYVQVALSKDPELMQLLQEARPGLQIGRKTPVELVVASRQRSEMGEGEDGPIGLFMPLIDMLNHHPYGSRYERNDDGDWLIRVHHPEASEQVFVRYNKADALGVAIGLGYGETATRFVASVACTVAVDGVGTIDVSGIGTNRQRLPAPRVWSTDEGFRLGGLQLQQERLPALQQMLALPLQASGRADDPQTALAQAEQIVQAVLLANREYYRRLLDLCEQDGPAAVSLRQMFAVVCRHQLGLLDDMLACVGDAVDPPQSDAAASSVQPTIAVLEEPYAPTITTDSEPWVARLPGLGTVRVDASGAVEVTTEPDLSLIDLRDSAQQRSGSLESHVSFAAVPAAPRVDSDQQKADALRYGWGDLLSWARRGYRLASGAAAYDPESRRCLLICGDAHDTAAVLLELAKRGWRVLSDRATPVEWLGDSLLAHPREAPILAARRRLRKVGLSGERVRADGDARIAPITRETEVRVISGVVSLVSRRPDETPFELLTGHERFESASSLLLAGLLGFARRQKLDADAESADAESAEPADESSGRTQFQQETLAEHLRLAALPLARLRFDSATLSDDIAAIADWEPGTTTR